MRLDELRPALTAAGVPGSWVALDDGQDDEPDEVVLSVAPRADEWFVVVTERGAERDLTSYADEDAAVDAAYRRLTTPMPVRTTPLQDYEREAAGLLREQRLREHVAWAQATPEEGSRPSELAPGEIVDRFGSPLGSIVFPEGTPLAQRSQPPTVLGAPEDGFGYRRFLVLMPLPVVEQMAEPWFGQPGGGLRLWLRIAPEGGHPSLAELVGAGALQLLPRTAAAAD